MAASKLNKAIRLIALVVLLGVVVYVYFLSTTDNATALKQKLSLLSLTNLAIPIALSLLSYCLRFVRWRLILKQMGHQIPLNIDFICYLSGFALTMTPGKSGETIRSAFLLQSNVPVKASLSAFIIERSFDLLIVGLLATLLFLQPIVTLILLSLSLIVIALVSGWLVRMGHGGFKDNLPKFIWPLIDIFSRASVALKARWIVLYALLGVLAWVAQGMSFYCIVSLFSAEIEISGAITTYCAGLVIGAASLIPGGIGVTEGSLSWLLQRQGVEQSSAILSALISRGCTLWLAVAVGSCALAAIIHGKTIPKTITE